MSQVANFTTPMVAGDKTPFNFIVYGDMGLEPFPEGIETAKLVRQEIDDHDVRFVYHHGDISYARGYVRILFNFICQLNSAACIDFIFYIKILFLETIFSSKI